MSHNNSQSKSASASTVTASAPATVANVACGFDVLGFCLNGPSDEVTATATDTKGVVISEIIGLDADQLSKDPTKNCIGVVASAMLEKLNTNTGVILSLKKGLPIGSGLGSSAASSAAAAFAVNKLFNSPFTRKELIQFAMQGELLASGSAHADNVAPSLLGGFTIIRSSSPLDVISVPAPTNLWYSAVSPKIEIRTADARRVLRLNLPLKDAVIHFGNIAGLIAGLFQSDLKLIGRCIEDVIIEPARASLIPGFSEAKKAALDNGALGFSISGSGPSVFALSDSEIKAKKIAEAVNNVFIKQEISSSYIFGTINTAGAL